MVDTEKQTSGKVTALWVLGILAAIGVAVYVYFARESNAAKMAKVREAKEIKRQMNLADVSEN